MEALQTTTNKASQETGTATNAVNKNPVLQTGILDLIDQHSHKTPEGIAAEFEGKSITFGQLRNASIHVAMMLKERGFRPRDRIPLLTRMGLDMVVAVVGVLRLGAAYCPMDSELWSPARVLATLETVQSKLVFATVETTLPGYEVVRLPDIQSLRSTDITRSMINEVDAIRSDLRANDLIYIIFTSGTTGKPKGVMVPHSSAVHLVLQDFPGFMKVLPGERALLFFSVAFDGCAGVVFSTICNGGTLAMATASNVLDVAPMCTVLILTPSMLATLEPTPQYDNVRDIYIGGEAPTAAIIRAWTTPTRKVYNCYGPTECTTAVSSIEIKPGDPIVLGNVVSEVDLVLLDENLDQEVEQGEICVRGPCLAVGYLNNDELTREKFFFRNNVRHYRTGDLARRSKYGLHFVSRVDRVVKNRGFLINLAAEVEPALESFEGVKQAVAFMHRKQLVGFATPGDISARDLKSYLSQRYDPFIVPDLLFTVDDFPLTSNGKVDTKALQVISESAFVAEEPVGEDAECASVAKAFAAVFDRPASQISGATSFRMLGGNSLQAIKLKSFLLRDNMTISLGKLFELDTVSAIGQALVSVAASTDAAPDSTSNSSSEAPLTHAQTFVLQQTLDEPQSNYIYYSLTRNTVSNPVTPSQLRGAWEIVFKRHSILRTTVDLNRGVQTIQEDFKIPWEDFTVKSIEELKSLSEKKQEAMWSKLRTQEALETTGPQFWIIELPEEQIQMNWVLHHCHTDAWSFGILLKELEQILDGKADHLAPPSSFLDLAQHLASKRLKEKVEIESFWKEYAAPWDKLKQIQLPSPETPSTDLCLVWESDLPVKKAALDEFASRNGLSSGTVLSTAWLLMLQKYTGSDTVGMKVSVSNRNLDYRDVGNVVGLLAGRCPLITQITRDAPVLTTLKSVQRSFYRANDFAWTYPELRQHIDTESDSAYWFDSSMVSFMDVPVEPGPWHIFEDQLFQAPIELGFTQKGEMLHLSVHYDASRYNSGGIEEIALDFTKRLCAIVGSSDAENGDP